MLVMVHENPVLVRDGILHVDRKFHIGMQKYCELIGEPIWTINPTADEVPSTIDVIGVEVDRLGYGVLPVKIGRRGKILDPIDSVRELIGRSKLVYGQAMGCATLAKSLNIPYIALYEYDFGTRLTIARMGGGGFVGRTRRSLACLRDYAADMAIVRNAYATHCNGYPILAATRWLAHRQVFFLETRVSGSDVIAQEDIDKRTMHLGRRPFRLIYSGRYEPMKGAADAVAVAAACIRRGLDIELDCFGAGSLRPEMVRIARSSSAPDRLRINDPLPFHDLLARARASDLFICCHIQSDPSTTYLESLGCGLPIAGYANRMWTGMLQASGAGVRSPVGDVEALADRVAELIAHPADLIELANRARSFALEHCFESEYGRRVQSIKDTLAALA